MNCEFCENEGERQTADDLTKGLCWLWPDEMWICPQCLKTKQRNII